MAAFSVDKLLHSSGVQRWVMSREKVLGALSTELMLEAEKEKLLTEFD
ncbi:hypothetical protein L1D16_01130 [Vibrio sp. Isolate31]|nr:MULTISPECIES: hypothetical protein [unclassified Vibrio]MCG9553079.1 hypothetical protein [Vibrio sp. Isolate32]MCG9599552.1 hypothetical protein [Vibrio sp. Isolate31]